MSYNYSHCQPNYGSYAGGYSNQYAQGLPGLPGNPGTNGTDGADGTPGVAGAGAIIPFNANPISLTVANITTALGFGTAGSPFVAPLLPPVSFVTPRAGTITSLNASFAVTVAVGALATSVTLQLYNITTGTAVAVPGATVTLPLPALLAIGQVVSGSSGALSVAVAAGQVLALVAIAPAVVNVGVGSLSAGLSIS